MRTISHKIMAGVGSATALITLATPIDLFGFVLGVLASIYGGTAPDRWEYTVFRIRWIKHRTLTHWPGVWLITIAGGMYLVEQFGWLGFAVVGYGLGGLIHLLGDMMTPLGVPLLLPTSKHFFSLRLVTTGFNEFFIVSLFTFLMGAICAYYFNF